MSYLDYEATLAGLPWMVTTVCGRADVADDRAWSNTGQWGNGWNHGDAPWAAMTWPTRAEARAFADTLTPCHPNAAIRVTPCLCHECRAKLDGFLAPQYRWVVGAMAEIDRQIEEARNA